jgi:CheY-like chemotaxis protein
MTNDGQLSPPPSTHLLTWEQSRLRLLVVDDEPDVCDLLAAALQATSSCSVTLAHAKDALRALSDEDQPFDGIFLDIQMPGTRGSSFARSSAARPVTSTCRSSCSPR